MNASKTLRLALSAGPLLLALHSSTPARADTYQDRFCQLTRNLDVPGKSALSTEMATFAGAFAAVKSFLIAFAKTDEQRAQAAALLAQGKTVHDFLTKDLDPPKPGQRKVPTSWALTNKTVGTFTGQLGSVHDKIKAALAVTETKLADALKKASSVARWETVIKSQTHSADTSTLDAAEAAAMAEPEPATSYGKLFRPLVFIQYAMQTYPGMLDTLRSATSAICTKAKAMKAGGFVKTAADEYTDYLAQAAADFTRLEAFVRTWAPTLKTVASNLKSFEAGLAPVKSVADTLVTALSPLNDLQSMIDAAMTETLCSPGKALCVKLADYPTTAKTWTAPSSPKSVNKPQLYVSMQVDRRMGKLFDAVSTSLPTAAPDFSPLDKGADGVTAALKTLDSFFTALETVIDIPMDGEADALNAILAELNAGKLAAD